jgi:hypothetical protein
MSLGVTVGRVAAWQDDAEVLELVRAEMREIDRVLLANGLPAHAEPETLPKLQRRCGLDHMGYSQYACLLRAIAFSRQGQEELPAVEADEDPLKDAHVRAEQTLGGSHLIRLGGEGYFVPLDFPRPLTDRRKKLVGGHLGSSPAAMRELVAVAPLLGIRLTRGKLSNAAAAKIDKEEDGPHYNERQAWLILFESFRLGIEHGAAVAFH